MAEEITALATEDAPAGVVVREGDYGTKLATVEPGGAEFIPLHERHGRPLNLFWTWTSPNLEFATVFVGVLAVGVFGLNFWLAVLAIVLGTAAGSVAQAAPLSAWQPWQPLGIFSRSPSAGEMKRKVCARTLTSAIVCSICGM